MPTYRVAPTMTCSAPSKIFSRPLEALQYARYAADAFRVGYCVFEAHKGRLRHVQTFRPAKVRA